MKYKCLSLWQPWASLIAIGAKRFETRSWMTRYRGLVIIHAATKWNTELSMTANAEPFRSVLKEAGYSTLTSRPLPLGYVIAVAELKRIYRAEDARHDQSEQELAFGDWSDGRKVWLFENVRRFPRPIPLKGQQLLFDVELPDLDTLLRPA